jgi:twinkle protein
MASVIQFRSLNGERQNVDLEAFAKTEYPSMILQAMDDEFEQRAWDRIQLQDDHYGDAMPWPKTQQKIRFRPGEVTAWIGPNRDGKSLLLGYLAASWALEQRRVLMCSLEMDVGTQLKRISRQLLCTESPTRAALGMMLARLMRLHFFDFVGHMPPHEVLWLVKYAAAAVRCAHIVIDNLTLIVPPGRNTDESSAVFVRGLVAVARETSCHIHLVGHVRKPEEDRLLNRYDWRGTGACADMVHNVIVIQANERKRRAAEREDFSKSHEGDVFITVDKQRNGEFHGRMPFWWRPSALRLVEYGSDQPEPFDPHAPFALKP